jgi:hypothetical protein
MPYGGAFRPAWSLKRLLYLLGVTPRPDESNYGCNDHYHLIFLQRDETKPKIKILFRFHYYYITTT